VLAVNAKQLICRVIQFHAAKRSENLPVYKYYPVYVCVYMDFPAGKAIYIYNANIINILATIHSHYWYKNRRHKRRPNDKSITGEAPQLEES